MKRFDVKVTAKVLMPTQTVSVIAQDEEEAEGLAIGLMDNPVELDATVEKMTEESDNWFILVATSCGNPDYKQNPMTQTCPPLIGPGLTLEEAVHQFRKWVERHDLGSGNVGHAQVLKNDEPYCSVSYNGRCWDINDGKKEIFE